MGICMSLVLFIIPPFYVVAARHPNIAKDQNPDQSVIPNALRERHRFVCIQVSKRQNHQDIILKEKKFNTFQAQLSRSVAK